jgi:hypothetical protein
MSHWKFKDEIITDPPEDSFGFVYLIINKLNNMKYIGRKYFTSTRRKALTKKQKDAGRKNRTRVIKETDWKTYTGSSDKLNLDIEKYGKENFEFFILGFGTTKGEVNYMEEAAHFKYNVLTDSTYYNETIGSRRYLGIKKDEKLHKKLLEIFG